MSIIIQNTLDGSHTLYIPEMDEHYHSTHGAIQESKHVYIDAAFNQFHKEEIHVLEMGFGTGLNALLTILEARKRNIKLIYTTLEKYPLMEEIFSSLNYIHLNEELFFKIHLSEWEIPGCIDDNCVLIKKKVDFHDYDYPGMYDVVYYDAFAPDKQIDVWDQAIFDRLYSSMNATGILSTYCAKGEVRRRMNNAGFIVNRLPGPPGKREMLQAIKN